ncbi:hypothetical protein IMCC21906_01990 [Spongiibacter sp. IMCC21906]|uniref:cupin domain-containing protein n=1 Tax=Spongiibacter sp. IMCC21906 TaxID=1620392 RepID=UPI00062DD90A|nr:cupin domain-containing protein [Spongiibacter sp. IMCC21906]AKH69662.1 hypothetical protein IMCC21906_01990 [Spongiibacter sp. IMCC21906]
MSLQNFDVEGFLRNDWQRRPVLIRQALPDFVCPVNGDDLAGMACEEDIDSRLIIQDGSNWQLESGPFEEARFATLPPQNWTLLVQSVDHWIEEVAELNQCFRFLPRWRQQDIMISYAAPGGNVGPHFDQYDVFLIQGEGQRRWKIGPHCDGTTPMQNNPDLRLLCNFDSRAEYLLNPGDILYIPPGCAHWGIAESDDCITLSVGFRAPSQTEMLQDFAEHLAEQGDSARRYRDPSFNAGQHCGEIDANAINQARQLMASALEDDNTLANWFGRLMTHRPPEAEPAELNETEFYKTITRQPLVLALTARLAFHGKVLFADGESDTLPASYQDGLQAFCRLEPGSDVPVHILPQELLYRLYERGTLLVAEQTGDDDQG